MFWKAAVRNSPPVFTQLSSHLLGLIISGNTVSNLFQCVSSLSMFEELSVFVLSKSILNFVATKNNGAIPFVSLSILARSSGVEPILSSIQLFIVSPMVASAFWSL